MAKLNSIQIEDKIVGRCYAWWQMLTDNDLVGIQLTVEELKGLLEFFKELNDKYVGGRDRSKWMQLSVIMRDMEVSLENMVDEEELEHFQESVQCFEVLWKYIELGRI